MPAERKTQGGNYVPHKVTFSTYGYNGWLMLGFRPNNPLPGKTLNTYMEFLPQIWITHGHFDLLVSLRLGFNLSQAGCKLVAMRRQGNLPSPATKR